MDRVPGVLIQLHSKDIPVSIREDYKLAVWNYTETMRVWGLTHLDYPTQMCYELNIGQPRFLIERKRENYEQDKDSTWLRWYFDVGARFYADIDDLEEACKKLGIWNETPEII